MKNYNFILFIIVIFLKTGNVLSNESVFTVNNIEVNKNSFKNKEELIEISFKKGFEKLNSKILLEDDFNKLRGTNLRTIKNLISHYQITNNKDSSKNSILINLFFKRDKMYNFYSRNNISYSDVGGKNIEILPILTIDDEIFIYDNNFFYSEWLNDENNIDKVNKSIEYTLLLENIEVIEKIKQNEFNLEKINLNQLFDQSSDKDILLILVNYRKNKAKVFLKGNISSKQIVKNLIISDPNKNKLEYQNILFFLKKEILEIVKSQNIINIGTPSFLNVRLNLEKRKDLFIFQNILNELDLIDSFEIIEFSKNYAFIKIKYYGKMNIIREKLIQKGLDLTLKDNEMIAKVK